MDVRSLQLSVIAETLDGLDVAFCAFDDNDCALVWNRTFLDFFPEHAEEIHEGESYACNLRRFYCARLSPEEMPSLDRYIHEGVVRHRTQIRPFSFEHRGRSLCVSSMKVPGIGRVRIWKREDNSGALESRKFPFHFSGVERHFGSKIGTLFDNAADGIMLVDANGAAKWVNRSFVTMYGLADAATTVGSNFADVYQAAWRGHDKRSRQTTGDLVVERLRHGGAPFELDLPGDRWVRVLTHKGFDGIAFMTHVDITVLKRQQRELIAAERRSHASKLLLEQTLDCMEQGIMMVNSERRVEVCNRRAMELLDLPPVLMESRPAFSEVLAYQWAANEFARTALDVKEFVRAGGILDRPQLYERERPNGIILEVHSVPILGGGVLRTYTDITERKKNEERVRFLSRHDGLTSLVNREVFLEHLAGVSGRSSQADGRFAVHFIDLDRFKPVNDQFGHAVGDGVLKRVADRLRSCVRKSDVVARLGGDEFAILQRHIVSLSDAERLASQVLAEISREIDTDGHLVKIGASIGISHFPTCGTDPDILLRYADEAMYSAKGQGRNCFKFFQPGEAMAFPGVCGSARDIKESA